MSLKYEKFEDDTPKGTICLCLHCGEKFGANAQGKCAITCKRCKTEESRQAMCKENKEINKNHHCKHCEI